MKNGRTLLIVVMSLVFLAGLAYALYPVVSGAALTRKAQDTATEFIHRLDIRQVRESDTSTPDEPDLVPYPELLQAMREYNERIYEEKQSGLCDAWAYTAPSFGLAAYGVEDEVIGVLSVPTLELEMPIYLGATYDHMARGAAHLSQTSLPIGGVNTNCVIAGHCGWKGADYFRYLRKLEIGDEVTITNLWDTLTYTVTDTRIIQPNDVGQILIQGGKDMLTLLTCHPYGSGGRYRYVVYCERTEP